MDHYGIIGYPVKHSLSPALHNAGFQHIGCDAVYEKYEVAPEELKGFLSTTKLKGMSVTIPHKQSCMKYLDQIGDDAESLGAVNTIKSESGRLIGKNFDWIGVQKAFGSYVPQRVIMVGAGGVARAIAYALQKMGCNDLTVLVRNTEKYGDFADDFSCALDHIDNIENYTADTLVNATQVGMKEHEAVIPATMITAETTIFEVVYTPLLTQLVQDAQEKGANVITGEKMLLHQAIAQFEWWTGETAPAQVMEDALLNAL